MKRLQQLAIAIGLATIGVTAMAHPGDRFDHGRRDHGHHQVENRIDARQHRQADQIRDGARSGRLNPREAQRLLQQQQDIRRAEAQARHDGRVSPRERFRIERLLDRAERDIQRELSDRQGRRG